MKHIWIILPALLWMQTVKAQDTTRNLVYNPSFEDHTDCPRKVDALGTMTIVDGWYQPTSGSADYYNICGSRECGIPKNKLGIQPVRTGSGYCGIYCSKTDYREYLQTQLKEPLVAGRRYRLSFFVSLSEYSPHMVATIGGLFTQSRISDTTFGVLMRKSNQKVGGHLQQTISTYYQPQVVNPTDNLLSDTEKWSNISGEFVAEGGEQFLTIGNFYPATTSNFVERRGDFILPGAYYYIEDVSVVCLDCTEPDTIEKIDNTIPPHEEYTVGSTLILRDLYFDFDKSTLLQQSYNELVKLMDLLNRYPKMKIEIAGHTDNRGTAEYNMKLSENRARAVLNYLIDHGIEGKRLSYTGYGKSRPISTNDTEEGRANNRRVEVTILSM